MDAKELNEYLETLCADLDSGKPVSTWKSWARRLTLPAAFGLAVGLAGCGGSTPSATDAGLLYAAPFDGGAEAAAMTDAGLLYAAPFDAPVGQDQGGTLYGFPFDAAPADSSGLLYAAPFDATADDSSVILYKAPFETP